MIVWTTIILALTVLSFYNFFWKRRRLPPGPTPWPLIGNFPVLLWSLYTMRRPIEKQLEWRRRYGPMYTLWFGEVPVVFVIDHKLMADMFQRDGATYADRPDFVGMKQFTYGDRDDIGRTNGAVWQEHRRFVMNFFRELRAGDNLMQIKIMDELRLQFKALDAAAAGGADVDLPAMFERTVESVLVSVLFSIQFDEAHLDEFLRVRRITTEFFGILMSIPFGIIASVPSLGRLPYLRQVGRRSRECFQNFFEFFRDHIDARVAETEARELDGPAENFVDAFLKEKRRRDLAGELGHSFTIEQLEGVCADLWLAAQDSTMSTLAWSSRFIVRHPYVQKKMHEELDTVIGNPDGFITVADMLRLPYINAVVNESHRLGAVVAINLPRQINRDVTVNGYVLPKKTVVVAQFSANFYDEEIFADPTKFKPERFLTADGKLGKCDELIPFSLGKRQCPGEALARMELFLFVANLFNRYELSPGGPAEKIPLSRRVATIVACQPYKCRFTRRQPLPAA